MYHREERRSTAPVKAGEEITVKIEHVGEKGDGIARVKGFVIFVPNTKPGDEVKVKVTKVLKKVAFAEVAGEGSSESSSEGSDEQEGGEEEEASEEDNMSEEEQQ